MPTKPTTTDAPSSQPFGLSTSTPPQSPASSPPRGKGADDDMIPIVRLLEEENDTRKREEEAANGGADRASGDDGVRAEVDGASRGRGDGNAQAQEQTMAATDGEPEPSDRDDEARGEGGDEEEWEDFMADYWCSAPAQITPQQAKSVSAAEDSDLRPCTMQPELDEDPHCALSIRRECVDIGRDFETLNGVESDVDGMGWLSELGLECSLAVARLVEKEGGSRGNSAMGGLRIDLLGSSPPNFSGVPQQRQQIVESAAATASTTTRVATATPASAPKETLTVPSTARSADAPIDASPGALDRKFTPPPTVSETASASGAPEWKHKTAPLPDASLIHMTAPILTRTSLRSLVMKKWNPSYWMHYGPTGLLIFRSKEHMDDWRYNPYHGKKQRDFLVKLHVDFAKDMEGGEGDGGKEGVLGHRLLPVKRKSYGKNEEEM